MVYNENFLAPLQAFFEDISLHISSNVASEIALRAAGGWEAYLLLILNFEQGKYLELIESSKQQNAHRALGGEALFGSQK